MWAPASRRLPFIGLGLVIGGGVVAFAWWKRRRDPQDAEAVQDEKILLKDYTCPLPRDTAQLLLGALGPARFRAYQHALPRAPAVTYVRVQFLPEEHAGQPLAEVAVGTAARVEAARLELEALLLAEPWAAAHQPPRPLVRRHPTIPDLLVVPSAVSPRESGGGSLEPALKVVIVDRQCGEAVLKGSNVYCRGVLVASADLEAGQPVELWADLDDCRTLAPSSGAAQAKGGPKGGRQGGPKGSPGNPAAVLHGSALHKYRGRRLKLGRGVAALARGAMMSAASGLAVALTALDAGLPAAPSLNGVLSTRYYAQNLPSAVCAHVLNPQPGMRVLDMCAAPGGKTTHLASLMLNAGELFALDHSRKKVNELNRLLDTLGYTCARAVYADAAACVRPLDHDAGDPSGAAPVAGSDAAPAACAPPPTEASSTGQSTGRRRVASAGGARLDDGTAKRVDRKARVAAARAKGKVDKHAAAKAAAAAQASAPPGPKFDGFAAESFDAVLLDPPCSALGLRPRLRVDLGLRDLDEMVAAQRRLLWAAVLLLKPGGCLVFSTCTVNPKENEGQVKYALRTYPCLQLADAGGPFRVGDVGLPDDAPHVTGGSVAGSAFGPLGGLNESERTKVQRFHSSAEAGAADSVGFFVAKFKKTESVRVRGMKGGVPQGI